MNLQKLKKALFKDYLVFTLIGLSIILAGLISIAKSLGPKPNTVYIKVKVDQGLWWIRSQKPSYWYINSIKPGEKEFSLLGEPVAEILSVRYYPYVGENEQKITYDAFLTVKLNADKNYSGVYTFKRMPLDVSSPIDLEFPSSKIFGTVIEISEEPFEEKYKEKLVTLTKKFAFPWEYEAIQIGDSYFDGEDKTVEIVNKKALNTYNIDSDFVGNLTASTLEKRKYIELKVNLKVREKNGRLVFSEEQVLIKGGPIYLATDNTLLIGFVVAKIE
jgi:hypothetical protein